MKSRRPWVLAITLYLVLVSLLACSSTSTPAPTTTAKPTATPVAAATTTATPAKASPTQQPTQTGSSVSFANKTITIVVPMTAGGSTDITARLLTMFLGNYLPGKPGLVVRNIPGGAATIGTNFVYNARPDGLTLTVTAGSVLEGQLLGRSGVKYDLTDMAATMGIPGGAVIYAKSSIVNKLEDLPRAKGMIYGGSTGGSSLIFVAGKELINIPTDKVVLAYEGGADAARAFLAGETNAAGETTPGYVNNVAAYEKKGEVIPLYQMGLFDAKSNIVREALVPHVLTLGELYQKIYGKDPSGPAWDSYKALIGVNSYKRSLFLPPKVADPVKRAYWDAAERLTKDPNFLAATKKIAGEDAAWLIGETYDKQFKDSFKMKPEVADWLRQTLTKKYGISID